MITTSNENKLIIDHNGKHGRSGADGASGSSGHHGNAGGEGGIGERGQHGEDAQSILLHLSADNTTHLVNINILANASQFQLPLGNPKAEIVTKANGGAGGHGGRGGRGGEGGHGCDGYPATQFSYGSNGTNGGNGGNGGQGGEGGHGGHAGNLTVEVAPQDTDLLMLLAKPELAGGQGGKGGQGGSGGHGGSGGSGGTSYSWVEEIHRSDHDSEGRYQHHVESVFRTQPGGFSGSSGSNGREGSAGRDGHQGKDGQLQIKVEEAVYPGLYKLSLDSMQPVVSDDGIIEPGEALVIPGIHFKNIGMMPMPTQQSIQVSLVPNNWIAFKPSDTLTLSADLVPTQSMLVSSLPFRVQENTDIPAINTTFQQKGTLQFNAMMSRVNKNFPIVRQQTHALQIRYPIEISTAYVPPAISREEEAPFVVKVRNVSTKPLGFAATNPRLVTVDLTAKEDKGSLLSFHPENENEIQSLAAPVSQKISYLNPHETTYLMGTLKFDEATPAYTQVNLTVNLHLGTLENGLVEQTHIQQRQLQLQLADSFQYHPQADLVLVTNNQTEQNTIDQWQAHAKKLGTSISVWNTSLYAGLSYQQKRLDQGSFIEQMQGKVIVILNNPMQIEDQETRAVDCLDAMEILEAAKGKNVATYVIGANFNLEKAITPLVSTIENARTYTIKENFLFWRQPSEQRLKEKAIAINKQLLKANPNCRYVAVCEFKPEKKQSGCFSFRPTWTLGSIEMRETLEQSQAHIAFREMHLQDSFSQVTDIDIYNTIKLFPFTKKLQYLEKTQDAQTIALIKKAILSDLASELLTYAKNKWHDGFTQAKLSAALVNLKALSEHQFANIYHLRDIVLQHEYFSNRLPTTNDKILFPFLCRRTRLKNMTQAVTKKMLMQHFSKEQVDAQRKDLQEKWDALSREVLFEQFALPYKNEVIFDNQISLSVPCFKDRLPSYHAQQSTFKEAQHFFANNAARKLGMESYQSKCQFELR